MNTSEILESITYFYTTILRKASCSADWNEASISNAFMWADFCEQIYNKFVDEQTSKELDKHIHRLTQTDGISRCFDNLKCCSSQLCQAFVQNSMVETSFFENILLKVKPDHLNFQEVKKDAESLDSLCSELVESLQPISIVDSDQSLYNNVKAELFLDFLKDVTLQLSSEEQSENQLSLAFEMLCQSSEKMTILLNLLVYIPQEKSQQILEIQKFAVNWILLKLLEDPNGSLAHFLWKLPPSSLKEIAQKHASFHSFYLDFLTLSAQSLRLEYENHNKKWTRRISASEVALSYDEVVNHFQTLINSSEEVSRATQNHLTTLVSAHTDTSVWRDVWFSLYNS